MTNIKFCIVKVESVYERDGELVALREAATEFFPHFYELRCLDCKEDLPETWLPGACPPKPRRKLYKSDKCYDLAVQRASSCASCGTSLERLLNEAQISQRRLVSEALRARRG